MVGIWQRWNICDEEAMLCWSLSIIIKRFSEQIVCNRAVLEWTTQAKNTAIEQKRIRHSPRGNRTTFWFWMHFHEQTDFDGGPVQAHHKWKEAWLWNPKKVPFLLLSPVVIYPKLSSTLVQLRIVSWIRNSLSCRTICWNNLPVTLQIWDHRAFLSPHVSPISYHLACCITAPRGRF